MDRQFKLRLITVYLFIVVFVFLIIFKLADLQIFSYSAYKKKAESQHTSVIELSGNRGQIKDSHSLILAKDIPSYSLYAVADKMKNKGEVVRRISGVLDISKDRLFSMLSKDTSFVWIKRKLELSKKNMLESMQLDNLGFLKEPSRFYPQQNLAAHILGIVDIDNLGLEGVELFYNKYLEPTKGKVVVSKDSRGRILPLYRQLVPGRDGFDLMLTIDSYIQYWVQKLLAETVKSAKAKRGSVVVMNPADGKILAISNYPGFDPNEYNKFAKENLRNRAVTDFYEPGSVFKIVILTAVLAERRNT